MNIPERVEEDKSPVESKALPHENVIFRCWSPDCRKVATCRDGSGWDWCDDHIDQEKTGSVLHTAQAYYNVDFYKERVRIALTETDQQAREEDSRYRKIAELITSIFYYGNFKAETYNERELEKLLREVNLWPTNEQVIIQRTTLSNPPSQV